VATPNIYRPGAAGLAVVPVAVAASDSFAVQPSGLYLYYLVNGGGSPDNVVIDDPNTPLPVGAAASTTFADVAQTVANGANRVFLVDAARHRDPTTGLVTVTHSFITSVTAVVFGPFSG
jgi:hypothetical protein